jgi:hypothetical protein
MGHKLEIKTKNFFISYTKADQTWAEWIAWELEKAGYTTILQAWDFLVGSNFILEMQRATTEAERTIAVLSPDYVQGLYTHPEWAAAFAQDPTGEKGKLVPVRVRECELTGMLPQIIYIDLVGKKSLVAKDILLKGIHRTRTKPAKPPVYPGKDITGEINLGPLVAKMCNRRHQENEFSDFFITSLREKPGYPQVSLIHGEEKECHDSLIERLVSTRIKQIAERKWGAQTTAIVFKSPDWPHGGETEERQLELKRALFSEFDPAYMEDDLSATALSRLSSFALSPLIVIRHRIHASRWDKLTGELLRWYLGYWADLKITPAGTQFLIFLSVIYPRAQAASWWKSLIGAKGFDKRSVEAELQAIAAAGKSQFPLLILKELQPIQPHEVHDWFSRYNIYNEKKRLELSERIFETQDGRRVSHLSMADIEHALHQIHQAYVRERGYLA